MWYIIPDMDECGPPRRLFPDEPAILPSPEQIEIARTPAGGWTRATLSSWGVEWPPRRGWKRDLEERWYSTHPQPEVVATSVRKMGHTGNDGSIPFDPPYVRK